MARLAISPTGSTTDQLAAELGERGWVVLPEPLPSGLVTDLVRAFRPLLDGHVATSATNRGVNRYQMYVPFVAPFNDPALVENQVVLDVLERVLGPDVECTYYGSDTPFPGADHQPVHQDGAPLFAGWDTPLPPYAIALNVALVDVDDDNGPLECFPGPAQPEPDAEPVRFTGPAGTMLLRDTRLWHRGSPHRADRPRPMLALLYNRPWYRFVLDRPALSASDYDGLSDRARRLFRGADINPRVRASGDRPRLRKPS